MVRELNMDTQRQNFWKESIGKEAMVRLLWHTRYSKEFSRSAFVSKPRKEGLVVKPMDSFKQERKTKGGKNALLGKTSKADEQTAQQKFAEAAKKEPESLLVEMRPVSGNTQSLLYDGFSALGGGRYAYLQQRRFKKPEEKYEFPITSAWEIGWKINDCVKSVKPPQYGRSRVIRDSFYRPNGILYTD